jgi:vacuole morphology and inheritance protein 14
LHAARPCSKYLAEDNIDVRVATENVLADFLREIRDIARVQKQLADERRARVLAGSSGSSGGGVKRSESKLTMSSSLGRNTDDRDRLVEEPEEVAPEDEREEEWEGKGSGSWIPGQGVAVHYEEIVEILLRHVASPSASSASPHPFSADSNYAPRRLPPP